MVPSRLTFSYYEWAFSLSTHTKKETGDRCSHLVLGKDYFCIYPLPSCYCKQNTPTVNKGLKCKKIKTMYIICNINPQF